MLLRVQFTEGSRIVEIEVSSREEARDRFADLLSSTEYRFHHDAWAEVIHAKRSLASWNMLDGWRDGDFPNERKG